MHMALKAMTIASSSSATAAESRMGSAPPQQAPISGKSSIGFCHEHEEALSS